MHRSSEKRLARISAMPMLADRPENRPCDEILILDEDDEPPACVEENEVAKWCK